MFALFERSLSRLKTTGRFPCHRCPSLDVLTSITTWQDNVRQLAHQQFQARMDYVMAARTLGFARGAILFREILPNVVPVLIALITLEMGIAVVVEAILSFVGLSVSSDTPTWGGMIAEGRQIVHEGWWVLAAPLTALFATVVVVLISLLQ